MALWSLSPLESFAVTAKKTPFIYSVWMPYWKKTAGVAETTAHLSTLQEISPFSYNIKKDGSLVDDMRIGSEPWPTLFANASSKKISIIPSISSGASETIFSILSNQKTRTSHIKNIVDLVNKKGFAGIDIDYENKTVATKSSFSAFLKELAIELKKTNKTLSCTIEPRTPASSMFYTPPKGQVERANDYIVIGKYCDEIRIMAYDQTTIDVRLNDERGGKNLYAPIADFTWVNKVLIEAKKTLPANKIMLGIPTYGYEYEVTPIGGRLRNYKIVRSISYKDALELAAKIGTKPNRNQAGELSFTYSVENAATPKSTTTPATATRLVWFADASSVNGLVMLAKAQKLRGVTLFKIDGLGDPAIWEKLK